MLSCTHIYVRKYFSNFLLKHLSNTSQDSSKKYGAQNIPIINWVIAIIHCKEHGLSVFQAHCWVSDTGISPTRWILHSRHQPATPIKPSSVDPPVDRSSSSSTSNGSVLGVVHEESSEVVGIGIICSVESRF